MSPGPKNPVSHLPSNRTRALPPACLALAAALLAAGCEAAGQSPRGRSVGKKDAPVQLATERYTDPNGYFSMLPPAGWRVESYPGDPRGKVAFRGPAGVDLRVLVTAVGYDSFDTMLANFQQKKRELSQAGIQMQLETVQFQGRKAVKKTFSLGGTKFIAYDFLIGTVHHDLQYGAPASSFDAHLRLVSLSMETYEPKTRDVPPEEVKRAAVAKRLRLARIFLDQGQIQVARQMVREGLDLDPNNADLLKLQSQLPRE